MVTSLNPWVIGPHGTLVGPKGGEIGPGPFIPTPVPPTPPTRPYQKRLITKVYNQEDTVYLGTINDWRTVPTFTYPINSGPGSMEFELPRVWGEAGEPGDAAAVEQLKIGNLVKHYVVDRESGVNGRLIYQGHIREIDPNPYSFFKGTLVPRTSEFAQAWVNAKRIWTDVLAQGIAFEYISEGYVPGVTWDLSSLIAGQPISQTFERQTMGQIMDVLLKAAGGWYYTRLNPDNSFKFSQYEKIFEPATHRIKVANLVDVSFKRSDLERKRAVWVYGKQFDPDPEQGILGYIVTAYAADIGYNGADIPMDYVYTNSRIEDPITAQQVAGSLLEFYNVESVEATLTIPDSNYDPAYGYDIESLRPGDTVRLYDSTAQVQFIKAGMGYVSGTGLIAGGAYYAQVLRTYVIAEVKYEYVSATITLKNRPNRVVDEVFNMGNRLMLQETA